MDKEKYLKYLESYLTPRRNSLFDEVISNRTRHITVVAEDTYQDHNASALIRNCDCFGIQDLHIIEEINKYRLAKGMTQGSDKWVDLHYYNEFEDNTQMCIDGLKAKGYAIVATTPHEADSLIDDYDIRKKSAFFFGKEKTGLSDKVLDQATEFVKIPMYGFSESFNISVSAALILKSLTDRLHKSKDINWHLSKEEFTDIKIDWCLKTIQNGEQIAERYLEEN
ncbi:MAG: RNA methyltransferase [Cytophagales bacterium]|nr:RNA methyltransferase [Cytophagales bacterium]